MAGQTSPPDAAPSDLPYRILGAPVHVNRFDEATNKVIPGWTVQAQWLANGSVIEVFVADTADLAPTADELIRYYGAQLDALHALGG